MTSEEKQRDQIERERLKFLEEQRRKDRLLELEEEREKEARRNGKRVRQDDWEYQRQQKEMERDRANQISKLYESYKPNFDLTYRDATGRELSTKEVHLLYRTNVRHSMNWRKSFMERNRERKRLRKSWKSCNKRLLSKKRLPLILHSILWPCLVIELKVLEVHSCRYQKVHLGNFYFICSSHSIVILLM